jgi:Domain of Unknown Function (DUF928)
MLAEQIKMTFAIALSVTSVQFYPSLPQMQPGILVSQRPPDAPRDGNSRTRRKPGGGLDGYTSSCPITTKSLMALVPEKRDQALTTKAHPTFWFYIPYTPADIRIGEFSLQSSDGKKRIYRTSFRVSNVPGIFSILLPSSVETALEEGQSYQWHLKLYCRSNTNNKPDLGIDGWVQRVPMTPERQHQIDTAQPDIWFDSLNALANRLSTSPPDSTVRQDWNNLLKSVDLQELANEPLVGAVEVIENP